jgi:septal ring factor EnvC (AmiA/AmiB activator)
VGEEVRAGDVVALVGDTGSLKGPCLYFEIRQRGKPLDPVEWLAN